MITAALFTIAGTRKHLIGPSTDEWVKKMWYIRAKRHESPIRKNEAVPRGETRMDPELVLLSEVR